MECPKVPDEARSWEAIDIFLFSNGQQFSPPRKYHLSCEDLRQWDCTIRFLAETLYGCDSDYVPSYEFRQSAHNISNTRKENKNSDIQLYTLDGKQIHSPLELKNDNAYVAVKSPEPFVWAGYEEYVIRASRSREKRQDKLPNSNTQIKLGDKNSNKLISPYTYKDVIASDKTEGDVSNFNMVHQIPDKENKLKDNKPSDLVYTGIPKVLKKNNTETDSQKRNCREVAKNDLRKNQNLKPLKKDQLLVKRKNSSLIRKANDNNKIKQLISQNSLNSQVNNIDKLKEKPKQKPKENLDIRNPVKGETNDNAPGNVIVGQTDDVKINNTENLSNQENKISENNNNNSYNIESKNPVPDTGDTTEYCSNVYCPNNRKSQEHSTNFMNKDKNINIYLDIKLNGLMNGTHEDTNVINRCDSKLALLSHKESQVNIDVVLNKKNLSFINNEPKTENSTNNQSNSTNNQNNTIENKDIGNNNNYVVVYCKCDTKITSQSENSLKENANLAFLLPVPERGVYCQREIKAQMVDKASQVSSSSITKRLSDEEKDKVQENTNLQGRDDEKLNRNGEACPEVKQPKPKIDDHTQTDMSNLLIQVICEEDGHYTFCLPPLDLLKQYNMNTA